MPFTESSQFETVEKKETLGHQIEKKVGTFIGGSFDCVEKIENTENNGLNDKKGVDLVIEFEDGSKMAVDITTADVMGVKEKIKRMSRNPMVAIAEEQNNAGEIVVEKTSKSIPKAIIHVRQEEWEQYNIETINQEVVVYMPDKVRIIEEERILQQLIYQITAIEKADNDYKKATKSIKEMLHGQLKEVEKLKKEFV